MLNGSACTIARFLRMHKDCAAMTGLHRRCPWGYGDSTGDAKGFTRNRDPHADLPPAGTIPTADAREWPHRASSPLRWLGRSSRHTDTVLRASPGYGKTVLL